MVEPGEYVYAGPAGPDAHRHRGDFGKHHLLALVLFFLAAVTDVLDGLAARRLDQRTPSGAYFDPIADKCLMSGVFLALAAAGWRRGGSWESCWGAMFTFCWAR